jgi:endonuclease-3
MSPTKAKSKSKAKPISKVLADKPATKPTAKAVVKPAAKVATRSAAKVDTKQAAKSVAKAAGKLTSLKTAKAGAKSTSASRKPNTSASTETKSKNASKLVKDSEKGGASREFRKVSADVANEEMTLLCQHYPEADCELDFETPFQLITAVIMSAQTTDVNVNKVTKNLFRKYPDAKSLAEAPLDDIKDIIRSTGFFNAKATNIQNCAAMLVEKFGGEVPRTIEELITLPGVGRKTANVVLGVCFGVPGWTVDTHVQRLSKRLGFTNEQDPEKIEYILQKIFPDRDWSNLSITLIWHGRRICYARKPDCEKCPINHLCPSALTP